VALTNENEKGSIKTYEQKYYAFLVERGDGLRWGRGLILHLLELLFQFTRQTKATTKQPTLII
jgi:hypothetical protein